MIGTEILPPIMRDAGSTTACSIAFFRHCFSPSPLSSRPSAAHAQQGGSLSDTYSSEEFAGCRPSVLRLGRPRACLPDRTLGGGIRSAQRLYSGPGRRRAHCLSAPLWRWHDVHPQCRQHNVFWQGPSLGLNFGADGSRVMMLVYNLPSIESIYDRYPGIEGSIYAVGGLGMTALNAISISTSCPSARASAFAPAYPSAISTSPANRPGTRSEPLTLPKRTGMATMTYVCDDARVPFR